jgi:signal transduction histidine kinase/CheY-like chemotaxis protein
MKKIWLFILTFLVFVWVLFFFISASLSIEDLQPVKNGVLEITNKQIQEKNIPLTGKWKFYWNQLLTPKDTAINGQFVQFPKIWNETVINGKHLSGVGYATYKMTIFIPGDVPPTAIRIPDIYSSYRLFVNDSMVVESGFPAVTKEQSKPFWGDRIVGLPLKGGTVHLTLQIANYWHAKGGPHKTIQLGTLSRILKQNRLDWGLDAITTGFILMGAFLFFGLYIFAKNDKAILYFALFALIYSYRILGTGPYLLLSTYPNINWFLAIRVEYLSLVVGCAMLFQYIRYLFPEESSVRLTKILLFFSALYSLIIIFTPVSFFSSLIPYYLIAILFYLVYASYFFIMAFIHKRSDSDFALLSACIAVLLFLFLNVAYFKLVEETKLAICLGYILFLFLQSIILSSRFAQTLNLSAKQAQLGITAKSEFLSTMSHEIRTPLNTITGLVHILLKEKPSKTQKETLEMVLFSTNNLVTLVNDILDYSKLEENKMRLEKIPMNLREIAKNTIIGEQSLANSKNIRLDFEADEKIPTMLIGDPTRIIQVISNLIHNAIKFTEQGWVKLSLHCDKISNYAASVTIKVQDSGIGISPENQKIIFNRFTQADSSTSRKYGGTGLGLSICLRILKLYDSSLELNSIPGEGSTFWFTLNLPIASAKKVLPTSPEVENPLQGYSLLVAEDNKLNALIAKKILEGLGAKVELVGDGAETVEKFNPAIHHVILMDLNMPVMDGFEATKLLREKGATVPIIALTATLAMEIEEKAKEYGITAIMVKPFDPEKLCKMILKL